MINLKLENTEIKLTKEDNNIRAVTNNQNVLFINQDVESIYKLIVENFNIVSSYYNSINKADLPEEDINHISTEIVLSYLYMYNSWRNTYETARSGSMEFLEKDFTNPSTYDIIFKYLKNKFPADWKEKSAVMIGMTLNELENYYATRADFYNK